jgi:hypothetical protein
VNDLTDAQLRARLCGPSILLTACGNPQNSCLLSNFGRLQRLHVLVARFPAAIGLGSRSAVWLTVWLTNSRREVTKIVVVRPSSNLSDQQESPDRVRFPGGDQIYLPTVGILQLSPHSAEKFSHTNAGIPTAFSCTGDTFVPHSLFYFSKMAEATGWCRVPSLAIWPRAEWPRSPCTIGTWTTARPDQPHVFGVSQAGRAAAVSDAVCVRAPPHFG